MTPQHKQLLELAQMIVDRWGSDFDDEEGGCSEDISGYDAIDSLGCYVELAKMALETEEVTQ